jgi:hypothetical protein
MTNYTKGEKAVTIRMGRNRNQCINVLLCITAIVRKLKFDVVLERKSHAKVECTYKVCIVGHRSLDG